MTYFDGFKTFTFVLQTICGTGLHGELKDLAFASQVNHSGSDRNGWLQMRGCIWLMFCPSTHVPSFRQRGVCLLYSRIQIN